MSEYREQMVQALAEAIDDVTPAHGIYPPAEVLERQAQAAADAAIAVQDERSRNGILTGEQVIRDAAGQLELHGDPQMASILRSVITDASSRLAAHDAEIAEKIAQAIEAVPATLIWRSVAARIARTEVAR